MITAVTCSACGSAAFMNARGEVLPHTKPGAPRFHRARDRWGTSVGWVRTEPPEVCGATRKGARA